MVPRAWRRMGERWSVAGLGACLALGASLHWYASAAPGGAGLGLVGVSMPLLTGLGLLAGGVWLTLSHPPGWVARIAGWALTGAVAGLALDAWLAFVVVLAGGSLGDPLSVSLTVVAFGTAAGATLGYYATGLRRRERALERSEARFRALTENAAFAVVTVDETGTVRYANDAVAESFGHAPADLVGGPVSTLLPGGGDLPEGLAAALTAGTDARDWSGVESVGRRADGEEFPVAVSLGEYVDDGDRLFTAVVRDISDQKAAEARLQTHTERVTRLHELATDVNEAGTVEAVHRRTVEGAAALFDCAVARLATATGDRLVPTASSRDEAVHTADSVPATAGFAGRSFRSGEVVRVADLADTRSAAADESPVAGPSHPVQDGGGPAAEPDYRALLSVPLGDHGVLQLFDEEPGAFTDRDEEVGELLATHVLTALGRVEAEAATRRERDRLEEFASVLSHDIRNPLNVARGELQLAREAADPAAHLDAVDRAHERIARLIDDVLALARQGDAVGEPETVSLDDVVRRAWANVATGDATLRTEPLGTVEADRSRLMEALENLFRNSVEHGSTGSRPPAGDSVEHGSTGNRPEAGDAPGGEATDGRADGEGARDDGGGGGGVTVRVGRLDRGFYVADDGPGIPADERDRVFEGGYSTSRDGTGFGLPIVERIVTAHGWEVAAVESADGGARFEVTGVDVVDGDRGADAGRA